MSQTFDSLLSRTSPSSSRTCNAIKLVSAATFAVSLIGCGTGATSSPVSPAAGAAHMSGKVHGGQQPLIGSKVYLYAVSTTANAGAATSLLNTPGFVLSDLNGNFDISGDYTCPTGAFVYLLAVGGNPGLLAGNSADSTLAAGLGDCSALQQTSYYTVNEVTTVAFAYVMSAYATSETQIGALPNIPGMNALAPNFSELTTFIDQTDGTALSTNPGAQTTLPASKLNSLANSIAACVNSTGTGSACSTLSSSAGVRTDASANSDASDPTLNTLQIALRIAQNPNANVAAIYNVGTSQGPFQPTLTTAPADWSSPVPVIAPYNSVTYTDPSFFTGQVDQGNGIYYLAFPGNAANAFFGYYSYLDDPRYIDHEDLGYEFVTDADDGVGSVYLYDYLSGHTWYTANSLFPYLYDFALKSFIYYYPDPSVAGHYTSNPRYFYNLNTDTDFVQ